MDVSSWPDARLVAVVDNLLAACKAALEHVCELREAWQSGAIRECDGGGGRRSNRNTDIEMMLRAAIAKTKIK